MCAPLYRKPRKKTFILPQTSNRLDYIIHEMITKRARLFRYFHWLFRKFLLKLDNRKLSDCCYSLDVTRQIFRFSHIGFTKTNNFKYPNLIKIHWNRSNSPKNKPLKKFSFCTSLKRLSMRPCRQLKRNFEPPPASEFRYIEGYRKALVFILAFSINLLAFYHE